jgi:uracil-DNA glycosylase family 4
MMAATQLLQAYLEWQSEMGSEEVILPHPRMRKQGAAPATPHDAGILSASPRSPEVSGEAPQGLFASLAKALEQAVNSPIEAARGKAGVPRFVSRNTEGGSIPAFQDLAALWSHLEANPNLLQREAQPGPVATAPVTSMIRGIGPVGAAMALIGFEPSETDAASGRAFQGEAGALLEKMMRAIRLETRDLYLSNLIKVRSDKAWNRRELARMVPVLHAELALVQAPMVVLLGQECAQAVLKTGKTLDELRQETHRLEGREFFATYHPQELLRKEELKRKAWEDLQWLQQRMAEAQARP